MAKKRGRKRNKIRAELKREPMHRNIYAIGAIPLWTGYDFRLNFFSDIARERNKQIYMNDITIIMTPKTLKILSEQLQKMVIEYEGEHGPIEISEEEEKKG